MIQELERFVVEQDLGDGTYRKVPLMDYVERIVLEAIAELEQPCRSCAEHHKARHPGVQP